MDRSRARNCVWALQPCFDIFMAMFEIFRDQADHYPEVFGEWRRPENVSEVLAGGMLIRSWGCGEKEMSSFSEYIQNIERRLEVVVNWSIPWLRSVSRRASPPGVGKKGHTGLFCGDSGDRQARAEGR